MPWLAPRSRKVHLRWARSSAHRIGLGAVLAVHLQKPQALHLLCNAAAFNTSECDNAYLRSWTHGWSAGNCPQKPQALHLLCMAAVFHTVSAIMHRPDRGHMVGLQAILAVRPQKPQVLHLLCTAAAFNTVSAIMYRPDHEHMALGCRLLGCLSTTASGFISTLHCSSFQHCECGHVQARVQHWAGD